MKVVSFDSLSKERGFKEIEVWKSETIYLNKNLYSVERIKRLYGDKNLYRKVEIEDGGIKRWAIHLEFKMWEYSKEVNTLEELAETLAGLSVFLDYRDGVLYLEDDSNW